MKPVKLVHELCFDGNGKTNTFVMDIEDDGKLDENTIKELEKQFAKLNVKK